MHLSLCIKTHNYTQNNKIKLLGSTSLIKAALSGNPDTVKILLEHGADVKTKNKYGKLHTIIVTISVHPTICMHLSMCIYVYMSIYPSICVHSSLCI